MQVTYLFWGCTSAKIHLRIKVKESDGLLYILVLPQNNSVHKNGKMNYTMLMIKFDTHILKNISGTGFNFLSLVPISYWNGTSDNNVNADNGMHNW